jgi:type IV secretion system protein VirB6
MQQGGMALIPTTLILTAPAMAAVFFQGTLGTFMAIRR